MTIRDMIEKWGIELERNGLGDAAGKVYREMRAWLASPEADSVWVPLYKIEALRKARGLSAHGHCDHGERLMTWTHAQEIAIAINAVIACAAPPKPKDEILGALEAARPFVSGNAAVGDAVREAITARRRELEPSPKPDHVAVLRNIKRAMRGDAIKYDEFTIGASDAALDAAIASLLEERK